MNFVHIHWSKPIKMRRWGFNENAQEEMILYHFSLSMAYVKKLNQTIDLYTDSEGAKLLGHLPYDNIYVVLDDMDDRIDYYNWAAGKIEGLKHAKLGDIYIDGDVYIKTQKCLDIISSHTQYDGFFFGHETPAQEGFPGMCIYEKHNGPLVKYDFPLNIQKIGCDACNGGLIVFNNQQYKDEFIYAYDYMLKQLLDDPVDMNNLPYIDKDEDKKLCFDLVMEQRFLWEIGQKYNIEFLLDYWQRDEGDIYRLNTQANSIGVQHVIGDQKFRLIDKCKATLKKINPDIYQKSYEKLQSYI